MRPAMLLVWLALASLRAPGIACKAPGRTQGPQTASNGQRRTPGCPAGVPALTVPSVAVAAGPLARQAPFGASKGLRVKPFTFAKAAQVSWDFDLTANGTWNDASDGSRMWQLCIQAPGAHSLTVLFRTLRLPLHSELSICSAMAAQEQAACATCCQRLTLHSVGNGRSVLTAPVPGDTAVLEYRQPSAGRLRGRPLALRVQSLLLGVVPLPMLAAPALLSVPAPGEAPLPRAAAAAASSKADTSDPTVVGDYLGSRVTQAQGKSLACQLNIVCDSEWGLEASAVVLLIGADGSSGFLCTATLINAPNREQYLVTANHCLGQSNEADTEVYWGVMFNHKAAQCNASAAAAAAQAPQYQLLQGLNVVWNNEVTDVLLLRLDDEIPEAYSPYFLGWDASTWVQPAGGSVCIHHPRGDVKKIAYTKQAMVDGQFLIDDPTHYLATWDAGAMEYGSSGAMLIDATTRLGLGSLTGGNERTTCTGGEDIYGSLHVAWQLGLWQYLGTSGRDGNATMGPRQLLLDGPGLIVDPDLVVVEEGPEAGLLEVRLSDAPAPGELLTVNMSTTGGSPIAVSPSWLTFNESNWDQVQQVAVIPGDDAVKDGGLAFYILLQLTSDQNTEFYKRRTVAGVRLDNETPAGSIPGRPITAAVESSKPFTHNSTLAAAGAAPAVKLGQTTLEQFYGAVGPGAAVYYAIHNSILVGTSITACSSATVMRLLLFSPQGVALWSTAESCSVGSFDPCVSFEGVGQCSGFKDFFLVGTDGAGPYILAVTSRDQAAAGFSFELAQASKS